MATITYKVKVNDDGTKWWRLNRKLHREDGPAIEYADGSKVWYLNGKLHREDGPACEYVDGTKVWYLNGQEMSEAEHAAQCAASTDSCAGREVVVDGKRYRLEPV